MTVGIFPLGLGVIPPVWTLSVEIGFYIVLAFVAAAYYRRPFVGLALAAALLVAWHLLAVDSATSAPGSGSTSAPPPRRGFATTTRASSRAGGSLWPPA